MKAINIQVDETLYNQVKQHAQQQGKTLANIVREALQQYLQQQTQQQHEQNEIQQLKKRIETLEQTIQQIITTPKHTQQYTPRTTKPKPQPTTSNTHTHTIKPQTHTTTQHTRTTQRTYPQGKYETYIIQVMQTQPQQTWHWNTVAQEILKLDPTINLLSVKDRMNRMSKQGLLTKVGPGEYQLTQNTTNQQ